MSRLILSIFLLISVCAEAQVTVSGTVSDPKGQPLPGVNVWVEGTYDGASTDRAGSFSFVTQKSDSLVLKFTSIGYSSVSLYIHDPSKAVNLQIEMKPAMTELNAVQITSGTIDISDKASSVVMKPLDILTTASAVGDITGALVTLPGTATVANDGRLFVRGGSARETGIYIDGLRVGDAYGTSPANVPTRNRFDPALFKGVNFSTGGYGAEYGDALSSVLSLNSIDRPLRNQTDLSLMSVGAAAQTTLKGEEQSLSAGAMLTDLSPYNALINQYIDWERAPNDQSAHLVYRHNIGKGGLLKSFFQGSHGSMALRQSVPGGTDQGTSVGIDNLYGLAMAHYLLPISDKWLSSGGVSLSRNLDKFELDSASYRNEGMLLHVKQKFVNHPTPSVKVLFGLEGLYRSYEESDEGQQLSRGFGSWRPAAFAEVEWYASPSTTVRGGLREVYDDLSKTSHTEYRLAGAYQPYPEGTLSMAVGTFGQPQDKETLAMAKDLRQIRATHFQAGYQHEVKGRVFRVEAYLKDYSGFAIEDPTGPVANGKGSARGFDVFYRDKKLLSNIDFWLTYSYVHSRRRTDGFSRQVQPTFAPEHNFSAVLKYWVEAWNSMPGAVFSLNSGYPYQNPNLPGEMNSLSPTYASLSVNWSWLIRKNLILYTSCSNVFGRSNTFGVNYADNADPSGHFPGLEVGQPAKRFVFLGVFWTLSKDKNANQLNNL